MAPRQISFVSFVCTDDIASTVENIDLALFVGDYYYEYGNYDS